MKYKIQQYVVCVVVMGLACAVPLQWAAAASMPAAVDDARIQNAPQEPQNWLSHGGPFPEWYYSPLDSVTPDNVKDLKPAWSLELDTNRGQEATPLVVDGVLYESGLQSIIYRYSLIRL